MTVELICVGTEILLGDIVNTNAAYLSKELAALGVNMYLQTVVGDNDKRLSDMFKEAWKRSDMVILGGGLGPTEDDLTKETVCEALGLELVEDIKAMENLEKILTRLGYKTTANNYKQALVPKNAIVMYNDNGTAPGLIIEKDGHTAVLLPGPPNEMKPMFQKYVVPYIHSKTNDVLVSAVIKECGIGESGLETMLLDIIDGQANPTVATYAKTGYCEIRITAKAGTKERAEELIVPLKDEIMQRLGNNVFTLNSEDEIEDAVVRLLKEKNLILSMAESCTGGLTASRIVNVSGASNVFKQSFITYCDEAKMNLLGVKEDTLNRYTAVSSECAKEMALGCKKRANCDIAISITGYAGPDDSPKEPKGLVYIGCAYKDEVKVREFKFSGNRAKIRDNAAIKALNIIRKTILENF